MIGLDRSRISGFSGKTGVCAYVVLFHPRRCVRDRISGYFVGAGQGWRTICAQHVPQLSSERMASLCGASYQEQAARILRDYLEDYTIAEIEQSVNAAYDDKHFDDPAVTPLHTLMPDVHVLELFHGPTLAFKDVALTSAAPPDSSGSRRRTMRNGRSAILVATSGDTGKAALEGFKDVPGTRCAVFYPYGGVSRMQELQMATTGGGNTPRHRREGQFRRRADRREASVLRAQNVREKHERHGHSCPARPTPSTGAGLLPADCLLFQRLC